MALPLREARTVKPGETLRGRLRQEANWLLTVLIALLGIAMAVHLGGCPAQEEPQADDPLPEEYADPAEEAVNEVSDEAEQIGNEIEEDVETVGNEIEETTEDVEQESEQEIEEHREETGDSGDGGT